MGISDKYWMQLAYEQAQNAAAAGEVPVGAVLVSEEGVLLAQAHNRVECQHNPCAHAEMLVLQQAAQLIKNHRLLHTTLYVTLEPCAMCAAALVHARIKRLVFAVRDFKAGAAGSVFNLLQGRPLNHQVHIDEGIMQSECTFLLQSFFQALRNEN